MKKHLMYFILCMMPYVFFAQNESRNVDLDAVVVLDQMGETIGELTSVSFHLSVANDELNADHNMVKRYKEHDVKMVGPDKMLVKSHSMGRNRGYWYNGDHITYYAFDENNYITIPAPTNIIEMIDFMNEKFDMDFPAADFFYPSFTDDVLEAFNTISYKGEVELGGQPCYLIHAENDSKLVQLWVTADAYTLPKNFVITYKKEGNKQYQATFSDWELNPEIPENIFDFTPPYNARLISVLLAKS
ncbi:DUF2092 domain-containing protein [Formosa sp. A9]|uniref:DUF2092 domain-containing protein n=1 Tax=Formosa sp. A9 TaxID=3442641 RepID=UPI003EBFEC81